MPWIGLLLTLGWNYATHRHRVKHCPDGCDHWWHLTICALTRRVVPKKAIAPTVLGGASCLIPHLTRGYRSSPVGSPRTHRYDI